jgi:hypothetical protein
MNGRDQLQMAGRPKPGVLWSPWLTQLLAHRIADSRQFEAPMALLGSAARCEKDLGGFVAGQPVGGKCYDISCLDPALVAGKSVLQTQPKQKRKLRTRKGKKKKEKKSYRVPQQTS